MQIKTRLAAATVAAGALGLVAAMPASANGPVGGCPGPFELFAIADAPPFVQADLTAFDQQGNGDGYLCRFDTGNPHPGYTIIDNHDVG